MSIEWITDDGPGGGFRLPAEEAAAIAGILPVIDRLYAEGRDAEAEDLDAQVEDLMEQLDDAGEELDSESWDVAETGIEDYETDECDDEGFLDRAGLWDYWEPHMLTATDEAA